MLCYIRITKERKNMKRLVLELDDEKHQKIKEKAIKEKKSMRTILTELVDKWLGRK